jgi:hypothetical protein
VAEWVERKRQSEYGEDRDIFVMGDFNIPNTDGPAFEAISEHGLVLPDAIRKASHGSNLEKNKRYDQILHLPQYGENFINSGGILDFYKGSHKPLFPQLDKNAFTYQLSDHLPLWVQVNTEITDQRLHQIIQSKHD